MYYLYISGVNIATAKIESLKQKLKWSHSKSWPTVRTAVPANLFFIPQIKKPTKKLHSGELKAVFISTLNISIGLEWAEWIMKATYRNGKWQGCKFVHLEWAARKYISQQKPEYGKLPEWSESRETTMTLSL